MKILTTLILPIALISVSNSSLGQIIRDSTISSGNSAPPLVLRDGTIGPNNSEQPPLVDGTYTIDPSLGQQLGSNLFHSFSTFSLSEGQTAHFTIGNTLTENIISRVTGANSSMINGLLRADTNFYLINPNGIIFGPNGSLDINGSFNISTSSSLEFDNGAVFGIDQPINTSLLSVAAPSDFGFLSTDSGDITFDAGYYNNSNGDLFLHANTINLVNGAYVEANNNADIELFALDTISLSGADVNGFSSSLLTTTDENQNAGNITVASENIEILDGGSIYSGTSGKGDAGNVDINTNSLLIVGIDSELFSGIGSQSESVGNAGNVLITAHENIEIFNYGSISSSTFNEGASGSININTNSLFINGSGVSGKLTGITSQSESVGNAGNVSITADENIEILNGGEISSATFNEGDAGSIDIHTNSLLIDNNDSEKFTGITSQNIPGTTGNAGNISITADENIEILNGGAISSSTFGEGTAGSVDINTSSLLINGNDSEYFTGIGSQSSFLSTGNAGKISISGVDEETIDIYLKNEAGIRSSNNNELGTAGSISITNASEVILENNASISIQTLNGFDPDNPAQIELEADSLRLDQNSTITSQASGEATAGNINVATNNTTLLNGSLITTESEGGAGGNINVDASDQLLMVDSEIISNANGDENGGDITINSDLGVFVDSNILAQGANGGGVDINIPEGRGFSVGETEINARSNNETGVDGIVNAVNVVEVEEELEQEVLDTSFIDVSSLIRQSCSNQAPEGQLTVAQHSGIAAAPDGLLPSKDALPATVAQNTPASAAVLASVTADEPPTSELSNTTLRGMAQTQWTQGQYQDAAATLGQAITMARRSGHSEREAAALGSLGNVLIASGKPGTAELTLLQAVKLAQQHQDTALLARLYNNLGNYYSINQQPVKALDNYQHSVSAASESGQVLTEAKAHANSARFSINHPSIERAVDPSESLQQASTLLQTLTASVDKVNLHIHLGVSYRLLAQDLQGPKVNGFLQQAYHHLQQANESSQSMDDQRLVAYALGNLGTLYQQQGRDSEALSLTRKALYAAEQARDSESQYRWHWQEGQLLRANGQSADAIAAYQRALDIIEKTRQTTLARYAAVDAHFKQQVDPIYRELAELLIEASAQAETPAAAQQLLRTTRDVIEQLKVAELQNYFHDDCVAGLEAKRQHLDSVSPMAAIVYPIVLSDRLELLVSLPNKNNPKQRTLIHRPVTVAPRHLKRTVNQLRRRLESISDNPELVADTQRLYQWLVQPYRQALQDHAINTLVFVPDGVLRTLPFATLHDGHNYLIADYAIATASGLALTDPQPLNRKDHRLLLAGVSDAVNNFPPLEAVLGELHAVKRLYGGDLLLNDTFTSGNLAQRIEEQNYGIIHIASHAQFTGDNRSSFLQAHDQPLSMDHLESVLKTTKYRETPLEMLVLSACQTAVGDERAALGLAGVGIKAGARSAMGSLWNIGDDSAAHLMEEFYTELQQNKSSKAEALRQAQLTLLANPRYAHPAHWSAFMLIDDWL